MEQLQETRRRSRKRKSGMHYYHSIRRLAAFVLSFAMLFVNIGNSAAVALAAGFAGKVEFQMSAEKIWEAAEEAVRQGNRSEGVSFGQESEEAAKYQKLFSQGTLYEITKNVGYSAVPDVDGIDLRVFIRTPQEAGEGYRLTGDEELVFLYLNSGDETIAVKVNIDGEVSGEAVVKSYEEAFGKENVSDGSEKTGSQGGQGSSSEGGKPENEMTDSSNNSGNDAADQDETTDAGQKNEDEESLDVSDEASGMETNMENTESEKIAEEKAENTADSLEEAGKVTDGESEVSDDSKSEELVSEEYKEETRNATEDKETSEDQDSKVNEGKQEEEDSSVKPSDDTTNEAKDDAGKETDTVAGSGDEAVKGNAGAADEPAKESEKEISKSENPVDTVESSAVREYGLVAIDDHTTATVFVMHLSSTGFVPKEESEDISDYATIEEFIAAYGDMGDTDDLDSVLDVLNNIEFVYARLSDEDKADKEVAEAWAYIQNYAAEVRAGIPDSGIETQGSTSANETVYFKTVKVYNVNTHKEFSFDVGTAFPVSMSGQSYNSVSWTVPELSKFLEKNSSYKDYTYTMSQSWNSPLYGVYSSGFTAQTGGQKYHVPGQSVEVVMNHPQNKEITYYVTDFKPGSTGTGGNSSGDDDLGGYGGSTMTFKIVYHSNYPDGTDYIVTRNCTAKYMPTLGYTNVWTFKSYSECGFGGYDPKIDGQTWYKDSDCTARQGTLKAEPNQTYHLYAGWKTADSEIKPLVTLTYMDHGKKYGETESYQAGSSVLIRDCTNSYDNYEFMGWDTDSSAQNVVYEKNGTLVLATNTILYAVWQPRIQDNGNGISITKTRVNINGDSDKKNAEVGDTITWNVVVTNNSNVKKTVKLTEKLKGATLSKNEVTLDPGASETVIATYKVVEADKNTTLYNTVTGTTGDNGPNENPTVEDEGTTIQGDPTPTSPALKSIIKTAVSVEPKTVKAGDNVTVTYQIVVTGDEGARYNVTDEDTTLVSGNWNGTLDSTRQAIVIVKKTVKAENTSVLKITNTAYVRPESGTDPIQPGDPDNDPTDPEKGYPSNEVITEIPITPQLIITKRNDGFKLDPQTGKAAVDYTVEITNKSGFDIYGLRLTDVLQPPTLTKVNPKDEGKAEVKLSFRDFKVKKNAGGSTEDISTVTGGAEDLEHVLQLLDRKDVFRNEQTVTLTYTVDVENQNDKVEVKVKLVNTATGASWSRQKSAESKQSSLFGAMRSAPLEGTYEEPDIFAEASSNTDGTSGGNSSDAETVLPRKYSVVYEWNLTDSAAKLPGASAYFAEQTVTVDTTYKKGSEITTADGKTYIFSGWNTNDVVVENDEFTMPGKDVTLSGTWTEKKDETPDVPDPDKPNPDDPKPDNPDPENPTPPSVENADYTVEWYDKDTNELIKETETRSGVLGSTVSVTEDDKVIDGYTFVSGQESGILLSDGNTVLKLYFTKNDNVVVTPDPERKDADYTIVHEYYTNGTKVGEITRTITGKKVGDTINLSEIERITTYGTNTFRYTSSNTDSLILNEETDGNKFVLRYDRTVSSGGSGNGGNGGSGGSGGGSRATNIRGRSENTENVTVPEEDVPTTQIPEEEILDEDVPLANIPVVDIPDADVPLAGLSDDFTNIFDEDVPLANVPRTSDGSGMWHMMALLSMAGLFAMSMLDRKKRQEKN